MDRLLRSRLARGRRLPALAVGASLLIGLAGCGAATATTSATTSAPARRPPSAVPGPAATTPTPGLADAGESGCHLVSTARTNQTRFRPGQLVVITIIRTNTGPACGAPVTNSCGGGVSAQDRSGHTVWDSNAGPDTPVNAFSCPAEIIPTPTTVYPQGWSQSSVIQWAQDRCTFEQTDSTPMVPNPDCPRTQVPPGPYSLAIRGVSGLTGVVSVILTS